jgi:cGMP-dependent protein kinase
MSQAEKNAFLANIIPNPQRGDMLRDVPILRGLSESQRDKLGGLMRERNFKPEQAVFHDGDVADGFFIILEGRVRVTKTAGGKTTTFATLRNGDYFGEMAIMNDDRRGADITAETDLFTLFLPKDQFALIFGAVDVEFAQRRVGVTSAEHTGGAQSASATAFSFEEELGPNGEVPAKPADVADALVLAFNKNPLLAQMEPEQKTAVVAAMRRARISKNTPVIKEGEPGAHLFIIDSGTFSVEKGGKKVGQMGPGTIFGELALLYNAPRAATVTALENSAVWVVDRFTFRKISRNLAESTIKKVAAFLQGVPLLRPLTESERERIAEAVEEVALPAHAVVCEEGHAGDCMFFLVSGKCVATKASAQTATGVVREYTESGSYFGELALQSASDGIRKATVTATEPTVLLKLGREAFRLLLGPLDQLMQKHQEKYSDYGVQDVAAAAAGTAVVEWGQLKVLGTLGKGSFGHVQLVVDTATGTQYALKSVWKSQIVETQQQGHIMSEKKVMETLQHPFLNTLHGTFQSKDKLHFLLEPCLGGELFTVLRQRRLFAEDAARFYAASVVLAFAYMHSKDTVYRDLKPENLMLTAEGFLKVADFGFAKRITGKTWTLCGTPDYLAPEIVASRGHGKGVDWWTLGVLIFEMLASYPPFYDEDQIRTYNKILEGNIRFPSHFSEGARSLISGLLERRSVKRLGVGRGGVERLTSADWFVGLDWDALANRRIQAPPFVTPKDPAKLRHEPVDRSPNMAFHPVAGDNWDAEFGPNVDDGLAG